MKGFSSKLIALKVDPLKGRKMYCFQVRACIFQPGNFTSWSSEGVNDGIPANMQRCRKPSAFSAPTVVLLGRQGVTLRATQIKLSWVCSGKSGLRGRERVGREVRGAGSLTKRTGDWTRAWQCALCLESKVCHCANINAATRLMSTMPAVRGTAFYLLVER